LSELTPFEKWKQSLGETRPWDVLNPNTEWAPKEVAAERYEICKKCPFLISATKQCSKCGCIMHVKTRLAKAECPEGKWNKV